MTWQDVPKSRAAKERMLGRLFMDLRGLQEPNMSMGQSRQEEWQCPKCPTTNWMARTNCRACRAMRPSSDKKPKSSFRGGEQKGADRPKSVERPKSGERSGERSSDFKKKSDAVSLAEQKTGEDVDMGEDPLQEGPDANPEWASMDIPQLKGEAQRLDKLHRELVDTKCGPAAEHVQCKVLLLRAYLRSRLPMSQRLDSLTAAVKKSQKLQQSLETKETELISQLEATRLKLAQAVEEETTLQKQLDEAKQEWLADTQIDHTQPAISAGAAEDLAKKTTGAIQTGLSAVPGFMATPEVSAAIGAAVQSVMASMISPVSVPPPVPAPDPALADTQAASEQQVQAAHSKGDQGPTEPGVVPSKFGPCEKIASRPEPYGKHP